jgi:hypothetical protein
MMMKKNLVGSGHSLILRYYPGICLEGLRKAMRNLDQDSQSLGLRTKPGSPEYGILVLTTRPRRSVIKWGVRYILFIVVK